MALVATVTGLNPTATQIRANLILTDDVVEVINQDFQVGYNSDVGPNAQTKKALTKMMQTSIDDYKTVVDTKALQAFGVVFSQIQDDLEV